MKSDNQPDSTDWPAIPYEEWQDTCTTLHLWTQIVGKIRLALTPWTNHSWHVPLYLSARGLTTSPIPYGTQSFEIEFDFIKHQLVIRSSSGEIRLVPLTAQPVCDFYQQAIQTLTELNIKLAIHTTPNEIADAIPFELDTEHAQYEPDQAKRFWQALVQIDRIFKEFRSNFIGKCSPVHFFWGSFDLAVTRFSGREAPPHPGGIPNFPDWVAREAYSHEVSSAGFWPGAGIGYPAFYSYAYPTPKDFPQAKVQPGTAFYYDELGEFILPYDEVRNSASPDETLLTFLQSSYDAAADQGDWDRASLELETNM